MCPRNSRNSNCVLCPRNCPEIAETLELAWETRRVRPDDAGRSVASARTPSKVRAARFVALAADALQIAVAPLFGEGFASPFNDVLDLVVAAALIRLLGFHWALLPTLAAELVPALDLAPTWSATVWLLTGTRSRRWWIVAAWVAAAGAILVGALWLARK